jgi:hypothetical protein
VVDVLRAHARVVQVVGLRAERVRGPLREPEVREVQVNQADKVALDLRVTQESLGLGQRETTGSPKERQRMSLV